MTALYIILGIAAFFTILFSIKITAVVHYEDDISLSVGWLFLKFNVLPKKEKPEKPKKPRKKKKKEESEIIPEPKKKRGENIFVRFYRNRGVSGVVRLLQDAAGVAGGALGRIARAFLIEEIYVFLTIGAEDSARTAIKYGKVCAATFPAMGALVDLARVKKYDARIAPDFIYGKNAARLHIKISARPLVLINAALTSAFEFLFKIVIKTLKYGALRKAPVNNDD